MKKFLVMVAVAMMTVVNANAQSAGEMFLKPMVGGTLSSFRGSDAKVYNSVIMLTVGYKIPF